MHLVTSDSHRLPDCVASSPASGGSHVVFFISIFWTRNQRPRRGQLWQRLQEDAWRMTKPAEIRCGHEVPDWSRPAGPHPTLPPKPGGGAACHERPAVTRPG